ncbi:MULTISPECIES: bifunctional folylpolyglutamate synthase/dihydrofolate synthase [unclassified Ligilactobacillus]|uniref:bifunctional folylpolyglutamate synthase/dihydrofolate synthase n=1 Tax=unclassified Ligilactobacillus TaxID=2767920 RepID=UPI003851DF37
MNYDEALAFIHNRPRLKKAPTLRRMRQFLALLGNPQEHGRFIHVTGTNGKGSVVAMLRNLLIGQGLTVGTFTSPYIVRFNERIAVNGKMITDAEVVTLVTKLEPIIKQMDTTGEGPTEFEVVTAMMFCYFATHPVDFVICEVGIGGTYDSTNVLPHPVASAIVTVAYDHMKLLGNSITAIAAQKAGIIKPRCPVVVGQVPDEAYPVIRQRAIQQHAPLAVYNEDFLVLDHHQMPTGERLTYHDKNWPVLTVTTALKGQYQVINAAVALRLFEICCEQAHITPQPGEITRALEDVRWPGRLEQVVGEPLVLLDGAHNSAAITVLGDTLKQRYRGRTINVIMAILADKDAVAMVQQLKRIKGVRVVLTGFECPPRPLVGAKDAQELGVEYIADWRAAFMAIIQNATADDVILFTGSLYFVATVRPFFKK